MGEKKKPSRKEHEADRKRIRALEPYIEEWAARLGLRHEWITIEIGDLDSKHAAAQVDNSEPYCGRATIIFSRDGADQMLKQGGSFLDRQVIHELLHLLLAETVGLSISDFVARLGPPSEQLVDRLAALLLDFDQGDEYSPVIVWEGESESGSS